MHFGYCLRAQNDYKYGTFFIYIHVLRFSNLKFIFRHMYLDRNLAKFGHFWLTLADWLHSNAYSRLRDLNNYLPNQVAPWVLFEVALGHQIHPGCAFLWGISAKVCHKWPNFAKFPFSYICLKMNFKVKNLRTLMYITNVQYLWSFWAHKQHIKGII